MMISRYHFLCIINNPTHKFGVMLQEAPPPYTLVTPEQAHGILLSTAGDFPGYDIIKIHGVVYGESVRELTESKHMPLFGKRSSRGSLLTTENTEYTSLVRTTRKEAVNRMLQGVKAAGANAAYAIRFDAESQGHDNTRSQVCCIATAVSVIPRQTKPSVS